MNASQECRAVAVLAASDLMKSSTTTYRTSDLTIATILMSDYLAEYIASGTIPTQQQVRDKVRG